MKKLIIILLFFFICFGISIPISANGSTIKTEVCKEECGKYNTLPLTQDNVTFVIKAEGLHHADVVIKQAILETGHFKSKLAKQGNLFGLKGKKGYYRYRHWSKSIIAYKEKIQSRYKQGEDYYSFLKRIKYCESSDYIQKLKHIQL